jgi:hypothetical protein
MRICVVSLATKDIDDMSISILNKQDYCKKHNYTFVNYNERFSKRHCPWDKIQCLLKTITWFDYVIWIDADAVFNNQTLRFEDIINEHPEKDLLICKDPCYNDGERPHCMVNTGVMIFKNTYTSIQLLYDTWTSQPDYYIESLDKHTYEGYPHEQGALVTRLKTAKYSNCYYLYEQTKFNTHPSASNKDTFIIHFMGSRQNEKSISDFINKVDIINKSCNVTENTVYYTLNKKNKIALTTMYTENIKSYSEISTKNKEWYANKYNIDVIVTKERLSNRHPAWDKIQCIINAMKSDYEYIIWMDADAIFLTDKIDFNTIVNIYPDKNFIVCNDPYCPKSSLDISYDYNILENLRIINTGVFIIKNNTEMKELIEKVWNTQTNTNAGQYNLNKEVKLDTCTHNWDDWPYEQGALHVTFAGRNDIVILPEKSFNTLPNHIHNNSFILHNMGGRINQTGMVSLFLEWNNKLFNPSPSPLHNTDIIMIGSNYHGPVKQITLDRPYKNPKISINDHLYSDTFSFSVEDNILTVKRTDSDCGWAYEHYVIIREE